MPCDTQKSLTDIQREAHTRALARLQRALALGTVTVKIGPTGSIAFKGWTDNAGLADLCAYRRLTASNSPELRQAVMRAQVGGARLSAQAINSGLHSHDGGTTWSRH